MTKSNNKIKKNENSSTKEKPLTRKSSNMDTKKKDNSPKKANSSLKNDSDNDSDDVSLINECNNNDNSKNNYCKILSRFRKKLTVMNNKSIESAESVNNDSISSRKRKKISNEDEDSDNNHNNVSSINNDDNNNNNISDTYNFSKRIRKKKKFFDDEYNIEESSKKKVINNNNNKNKITLVKKIRKKEDIDYLIEKLKNKNNMFDKNYGVPSDWYKISVEVFNKYSKIKVKDIINIIKNDYETWISYYFIENNFIIKSFEEYMRSQNLKGNNKTIKSLQYCFKYLIIDTDDYLTDCIEKTINDNNIIINKDLFFTLCRLMCIDGNLKSFVLEPYEYVNIYIKSYIKSVLQDEELKIIYENIDEEIDKIDIFYLANMLRLSMIQILDIMPKLNNGNDFLDVFTSEIKKKMIDSIMYYHKNEDSINVKLEFIKLIELLRDVLRKKMRFFIKKQIFDYIINFINRIVNILNRYHQVTLIGNSGAGKSTLLDLICLDNIDIDKKSSNNLYESFEIMKFRHNVFDFFEYKDLINEAIQDFKNNENCKQFTELEKKISMQIKNLEKTNNKISLSTFIFSTGSIEEKSTTSIPQIVLYGESVIGCIYYKSLEEALDELYYHFYNWQIETNSNLSCNHLKNFIKLLQFLFGVKNYKILNNKIEIMKSRYIDDIFQFRSYIKSEMKKYKSSYINIFDMDTKINFKMITGNKNSTIVKDIANLSIQKEKLIPSQKKYEEVLDNYKELEIEKEILRGVFASDFYCMIPNKKLKDLGCIIVDTPGIDDENRYRAKHAIEQIKMTDTLVFAGLETSFARSGGYFFQDIDFNRCDNIETFLSYRKTESIGNNKIDEDAILNALAPFNIDTNKIKEPQYFTKDLKSFKKIEELIINNVKLSKYNTRNENMKKIIGENIMKNETLKNVILLFDFKDDLKKINFRKEFPIEDFMNYIYPSEETFEKLPAKIMTVNEDFIEQLNFENATNNFKMFYQKQRLKALIDDIFSKIFKKIKELPDKIGEFINKLYLSDNDDIKKYIFEIIFKKEEFIDELNIIIKDNQNSKKINRLKKMVPEKIQKGITLEESQNMIFDFKLDIKKYLDDLVRNLLDKYLNDIASFLEIFKRSNSIISKSLDENEKKDINEVFDKIKNISLVLYKLYENFE